MHGVGRAQVLLPPLCSDRINIHRSCPGIRVSMYKPADALIISIYWGKQTFH